VRPERQAGYAAGVADGDAVDWRGLNRVNWDDRVPVHLASEFYDLDGFRAGAGSLRPFEAAEAGDVTALGGRRFDVVYTGTGALVWLPDIPRWAQVVAALLEPGGFLYLVEGHPFAQVLDDAQGTSVVRDYFDDQPRVEDYRYTYTDGPALRHARSVEFQHQLGQVVTALAHAGLRIDFLHEHDFDAFQRFQSLERHGSQYRFLERNPCVPMMFSLRATRPA
jgi:hypothetical protein